MEHLEDRDIPALLTTAKAEGLGGLNKLVDRGERLTAILPTPTGTSNDAPVTVNSVIENCLNRAAAIAVSTPISEINGIKPRQIVEIIAACLETDVLRPCSIILAHILRTMEGSKTDNLMHHLQRTYYDLFENLHRVLKRLGKPLSTNPIGDFTRGFIRLLMTKHVGPKPVYANPPTPSRIGCGCVYCNTLDDFLMNSERVARYSIGQARRKHLETRLRRLPGVCEWETERGDPGKASTLVITKNPALAEPAQWKWRANEMADMLFWIAPRDHHLDGVLAPGELEAIQESLQGGEPYEIPTKPTSALVQGPADTSTMRRGLKRAAEQFTNDPEKRKRRDQA